MAIPREQMGERVGAALDRIHTSAESFNRHISQITRKFPQEWMVPTQQKLAMDALTSIVLHTSWDTGRARGNWQVTINATTESVLEATDVSGRVTIKLGEQKIKTLLPYSVVWIQNNLPYILPLEDGHSKKFLEDIGVSAEGGMVKPTIDILNKIKLEES
jgi:hypothetical protein